MSDNPNTGNKSSKASGSVIRACKCKSEYQDKRYGKQNRVHNYGPKRITCTVCGVKS